MTLEMRSKVEQTSAVTEPFTWPYCPSWVDRFNEWVDRLPVPAWVFYLCLWLLLIFIESGSKWLDGEELIISVRWLYVFYSFYGVYFLAAIHFLDKGAYSSFHNFRPALRVDETKSNILFYQLRTMPARTIWLLSAATLVIFIVLYKPLITPLWQAMGFFHHSTVSTLVDLGIFFFNSLFLIFFIFHTLHQMKWISRIHKTATIIDLFQPHPLYSLSSLTARTAGILLLIGFIVEQQAGSHGEFTSDPYTLQMSWFFTLVSMGVYSLLAIAVFFLPLLGLHQQLIHEKELLQAEANSRLQAHILELHQRLDIHQLQDADAINKHMASLALERDILARLPTWPWQPGTLNLILTAVLLPIVLWIIQRLLEHWTGF